jgi:hypothetical protein
MLFLCEELLAAAERSEAALAALGFLRFDL